MSINTLTVSPASTWTGRDGSKKLNCEEREMKLIDRRVRQSLSTDLLVIGGGAAGVAAAVCAAREGLGVTLVERYGFCGGGAVAGLSGTICGLYAAHENPAAPPQKLVFGFVDEFMSAMESRGGLTAAVRYGKTHTRVHDPLIWREVADGLLRQAGVRVIYHAQVTGVLAEGENIEGARVHTKQGPLDIGARMFVDASGDADVAAIAGLPTTVGASGRVRNPTMIFRMQGVDIPRFLSAYGSDSIMGEEVTRAMEIADPDGTYLPRRKIFLFPTPRQGELLCNATRIVGRDGRELNSLVHDDFTEAEIEGRKQARAYADFIRDYVVGCESAWINDTGVQVGIRQSRQIDGMQTLTNDAVTGARKAANGIARCPWPIELHAGQKPQLHWIFQDYYEIPYECFVPQRSENLLVAGRCLSAQHEAMASARVTAQCFSYGQAIGVAAAQCLHDGIAPRAMRGEDLRHLLQVRGVALD
jgi:glycine/D-amino acid oxidase-like deaminating enzyme